MALQSCSEQDAKAFRNLFPLQNELKSKYQAEAVELTLENSHILDITLKNSPSSALGLDELKFRAAEVAQYAGNHYDSIGAIDTISVTFPKRTRIC